MSDTAALLSGRGIRPSPQRILILDFLRGTKEHPSADAVYRALSPGLPTLSRTTVYNTLGLFVREGLALSLGIDGVQSRFDGDTSEHGHFRCRACGGVYDFPVKAGGISPRLPRGFTADLVQLYCIGTCPSCAAAG